MARKLRFERAGGIYHVLNRGNYRSWIFVDQGAKQAFEKTLFETCERSGWVLHAYCIMGNHYHLAVETPEPNLSEGMRLLQSVFSIRFNRFRKEQGHLFQGRFKSIVVENRKQLGYLCHYIHLNPVRAQICNVVELKKFKYCSYRYLWNKRTRPKFLNLDFCLQSAGNLKDSPSGRRKYAEYLSWLAEDEPSRKAMQFERMSKGWVLGSREFKTELLREEKHIKSGLALGVDEVKEMRQIVWETKVEQCIEVLKENLKVGTVEKKSADWKIAIAGVLKQKHLCSNGWLAERLEMGTGSSVSRYVGEMLRGERMEARKLYERLLNAIVED